MIRGEPLVAQESIGVVSVGIRWGYETHGGWHCILVGRTTSGFHYKGKSVELWKVLKMVMCIGHALVALEECWFVSIVECNGSGNDWLGGFEVILRVGEGREA